MNDKVLHMIKFEPFTIQSSFLTKCSAKITVLSTAICSDIQQQWRPQKMIAANRDNLSHMMDNDGRSNDGHKPWQSRPQGRQ